MTQPPSARESETPRTPESEARVLLRGVPWAIYQGLVEASADGSGVRMSYLNGDLEIMTPSRRHERRKSLIGRLLSAYAEERDLVLNAYGSTTFKSEAAERGVEPDECFVLRDIEDEDELAAPDLAIEIVETRWKVDKLEIYRGLGVPEVWIWRSSRPEIHVLNDAGYALSVRSRLLPDLDLDLLASFSGRADQMRAIREYRAHLRAAARH